MIFNILLCAMALWQGTTKITSDQISALHHNLWGHFVEHGGSVYVVPRFPENGEIHVWRLDEGKAVKVATAGMKEGLVIPATVAMSGDGVLAIKGLLSPVIVTLDLKSERSEFKKLGLAEALSGNMIYWDNKTIVAFEEKNSFYSKKPFGIKAYHGDELDVFKKINERLPTDVYHESQSKVNTHQVVFALTEDKIAIGYTFSDVVSVMNRNGTQYKEFQVSFRGYLEAPEKYTNKTGNRAHGEYMAGFHHLDKLRWHQNELFGFFRKGFEAYGFWVNLRKKEVFWDNNKNKLKVLDILDKAVVSGEVSESDDGLVTWNVSVSKDFPK